MTACPGLPLTRSMTMRSPIALVIKSLAAATILVVALAARPASDPAGQCTMPCCTPVLEFKPAGQSVAAHQTLCCDEQECPIVAVGTAQGQPSVPGPVPSRNCPCHLCSDSGIPPATITSVQLNLSKNDPVQTGPAAFDGIHASPVGNAACSAVRDASGTPPSPAPIHLLNCVFIR